MELVINHQKKFFESLPESLDALVLAFTSGKRSGIAVAVNNYVIPRADWASTLIQDNDHILIITATQGG